MKPLTLPMLVSGVFCQELSDQVIYGMIHFEQLYGPEGVFISDLNDAELEPVVKMYINSPGGFVTDLFAMLDVIGASRLPVETYCLGEAASCGAVLFSSGKKGKRYIGKNSHILLHQVSAGAFGQIDDMKIAMKQAEKMNEQLIGILAKNTGKSKAEIKTDLERDLWLDAKQAVEYGIADQIISESAGELKSLMAIKDSKEKQIFTLGADIETKLKSVDLEEKDLQIEIKSSSEDSDNFYFEGYASIFGNVDGEGDVVTKGAFSRTLREYNLLGQANERPILWQHDTNNVIGKAVLCEDETGLKFKGVLPKADVFVAGRVIPQLKVGSIKTMSFGFKTVERYYKNSNRHLVDVELYEISVVSIPCNNGARIENVKNRDLKDVDFSTFQSVTDISRFLKEKGFSKSETDGIVFTLKRMLEDKPKACNEPAAESACKEHIKGIADDLKAILKK